MTLTGLQRGTTYQVRVRAVSDVGNGEWSEVIGKATYSGEFYIFIKFIKFSVLCICFLILRAYMHFSSSMYMEE